MVIIIALFISVVDANAYKRLYFGMHLAAEFSASAAIHTQIKSQSLPLRYMLQVLLTAF